MSDSQKVLWPQENRQFMKERIKHARSIPIAPWQKIHRQILYIKLIARAWIAFKGFGDFRKIEKEVMHVFNGSSTEMLADKYRFLKLCSRLGYRIPKQILVRKGQSIESKRMDFQNAFNEDVFGFFIKPESGYVGKGIKILKTRQEVLSILEEITEDTVIEETINIDKEFRYILYVDRDENRWHLTFQKVRPEIVGDGKSTVGKLIYRDKEIPFQRKVRLARRNFKILGKVLSNKEKIRLSNIGTPESGSYMKIPNNSELAALDLFVPRFISDLEKDVGHKLPLLCFDLGILKPLSDTQTFEEIKKIVTPFECQMPFSPYAHFKFIPHGFGPMIEFYRMMLLDMDKVISKRLEDET